ncbi:3D domain-containing protein [Virgibacillus halophilus]|uniref:3D domain-containing protein n=2 Tax=Tigheibacillus halophilus TaxID=361280 RepID=A0ABU5C702_9BACI|nr:3D domain-containing protein [Virgibacillus halophilus]
MSASAYTANCGGCSGFTATGINLKSNPNAKVVAVDPSVIPLGTKVWVEGYGVAVAGDTGGSIQGNRIDLHVASSSQAHAFGTRTVTVKILD